MQVSLSILPIACVRVSSDIESESCIIQDGALECLIYALEYLKKFMLEYFNYSIVRRDLQKDYTLCRNRK